MKPWFIREDNVVPFPKKDKGVVRLPNINAYPDFLTGVQDLQAAMKRGDFSAETYKKLYQDLIHRFMRVESFETPWFIREELIQEYRTSTEYKGYRIEIHRTKVKPPYVATITSQSTKRELQRQGGETEQEALKNAQDSIDSIEAQAPTISSDSTTSILFNTLASGELLKDPSIYNDIYAKIDQGEAGPILVIGNETYGADALLKAGFKKSSDRRPVKQKTSSEESMPQVMFPFSGRDLKDAGIKVNGRYVMDIQGQYQDEYQHTVYPLTFVGTTMHSRDTLRMSKPGFTVGTKRNEDVERPWFLGEAMGGMWDRGLEKQAGKQIQFTSQKTQKIYDLIDVAVFPQDEKSLSYQNDTAIPQIKKTGQVDVMQKDIDDYLKVKGNPKLQNVNSRTSRFNAAMLVVVGQNGKPEHAFVKYFTKKMEHRPYIYWQTSVFQRETGLIQSGNVKSATARAAELHIGPDDFVDPGIKHPVRNIPGIIETKVKSRSDLPEGLRAGLPALLNNLIKAPKTPAPGMEDHKDTIAVVFGELVSPIALAMNLSTRGSYDQAQKELLAPLGIRWSDFKEVEYGAKGQKLADSYLYAGDVKLVVSSKAKQGSPASITTAMETIQKYPKDFGPNFQKKYQSFLPALQVLYENDAINGVLKAAQLRGLITEAESNYVLSIYGKGQKQADLGKFGNLARIELNRPRVDRTNPKFDMGYHLLACVAKELKINLNKDKDQLTDFFKAVLNKSAMVQVYTRIDGNKKGLWFSAFDVIWPPVFAGRIEIESDHYTSNARPSKKFSFQFSG